MPIETKRNRILNKIISDDGESVDVTVSVSKQELIDRMAACQVQMGNLQAEMDDIQSQLDLFQSYESGLEQQTQGG